nr:hypothetical protein [Chloroflexia bacterium]
PMDRALWKVANYREFLAARRELLAQAANQFLSSLLHGELPEKEQPKDAIARVVDVVQAVAVEDEEEQILDCIEWVAKQGLPEPELMYELVDEATGDQLAVFDIAWPRGLQIGYSQPAAVLIGELQETEEVANAAGFRFFRSVDDLKAYVVEEILVSEGVA